MKKILLSALATLFIVSAGAQTVVVHNKNGQSDIYQSVSVKYVEFTDNDVVDTVDYTVEAVDLGLSVKWASMNVGASKPEEYGFYFSWGETRPKTSYKMDDYTVENSSYIKTLAGTDKDAAKAVLGLDWRMPTYDEFVELRDKCTWTWTERDGIKGYEVKGSNGNSIFLPAGGYKGGSGARQGNGQGRYWSASNANLGGFAMQLIFTADTVNIEAMLQGCGQNVRAVSATADLSDTSVDGWTKVDAFGYAPYWYCPTDKTNSTKIYQQFTAYKNSSTNAYKIRYGGKAYAANKGYNKIPIGYQYHNTYNKYNRIIRCRDVCYFEFSIP